MGGSLVEQGPVAAASRQFRMVRCLGQGGFGDVYLSQLTTSDGVTSEVAIKVLHPEVAASPESLARLREEARVLALLNHPNIVSFVDLVYVEGRVALVTRFVDGADLAACCAQGPLPRRVALEIAASIAEAIAAAWETPDAEGRPLHLVHRDIKPSNILLGRHGDVLLLDFGIAKAQGREMKTQTGLVVGTLPYIPPERFDPAVADSAAGDVYSLACTLMSVLTGQGPFDALSSPQRLGVALNRAKHDPYAERAVAAAAPDAALARLLSEMLHFDAEARPSSTDVGSRLRDLADHCPGPSFRRWCKDYAWPKRSLVAGKLDGLVITQPTLGRPAAVTTPPAAASAPSPAGGRGRWWVGLAVSGVGVGMLALGAVTLAAGAGLAAWWWGARSDPAPAPIPPVAAATPARVALEGPEADPGPQAAAPRTPDAPRPPRAQPVAATPDALPAATPAADPRASASDVVADLGAEAAIGDTVRPEGEAACGDPRPMELAAMRGKLGSSDIACLGAAARATDSKLTDRDRASRVLVVQHYTVCKATSFTQGGPCLDYEAAQRYHLEQIDRSDPTMMLQFGDYLHTVGGRPSEVATWAGRGLEERERWRPGPETLGRIDKLYRLRAEATNQLWVAAPQDERARGRAVTAAVDWLDYRLATARDTAQARALCTSAAGSELTKCNRATP